MTASATTLPIGHAAHVRVRRRERWTTFEADVPARLVAGLGAQESYWALLRANETLPHEARLALAGDHLVLRADVPRSEQTDEVGGQLPVDDALCDALFMQSADALRRALHVFAGLPSDVPATDPSSTPAPRESTALDQLADTCRAHGWGVYPRPDSTHAVSLDVSDQLVQASLAPRGANDTRLHTRLCATDGLSATSREAVALLLLRLSSAHSMVRPVVREAHVDAEVMWHGTPSPHDLMCALDAMSAFCRAGRREVDVLRENSLAASYLRMQAVSRSQFPARCSLLSH